MSAARWVLEAVDAPLDRLFGASNNPARHLGAIAFLLFWIVAASGAYLYAFYDTSVSGAWESVDRLTRGQWYLGGVARSLHRYAADGFVIATLAHLAREWLAGHFRGFRWFSWVSGVPLVVLMYASGIVGFWLAWDRLAQFSAIATAEWVDTLGFGPMMRNFLAPASVDDRLFSLFVFLHIGEVEGVLRHPEVCACSSGSEWAESAAWGQAAGDGLCRKVCAGSLAAISEAIKAKEKGRKGGR